MAKKEKQSSHIYKIVILKYISTSQKSKCKRKILSEIGINFFWVFSPSDQASIFAIFCFFPFGLTFFFIFSLLALKRQLNSCCNKLGVTSSSICFVATCQQGPNGSYLQTGQVCFTKTARNSRLLNIFIFSLVNKAQATAMERDNKLIQEKHASSAYLPY